MGQIEASNIIPTGRINYLEIKSVQVCTLQNGESGKSDNMSIENKQLTGTVFLICTRLYNRTLQKLYWRRVSNYQIQLNQQLTGVVLYRLKNRVVDTKFSLSYIKEYRGEFICL